MGFCIWFFEGFDKSGGSRGSNYAERLKAGEDCSQEYCVCVGAEVPGGLIG